MGTDSLARAMPLRPELASVLEFIREGDALVERIDCLARSIGDLQDIVRTLKERGATLKALHQPVDTGTAAGKCFLDMLRVFAEFETNLRRERQLDARLGKGVAHWTLHDLRRTAATLMARTGVLPHVVEKTLGHITPGIAGVYQHHSWLEEKRDAVERLAKLLPEVISGPVPLR